MPLRDYFKFAIERHASDLHLVAGAKPAIRVETRLENIEEEILDNDRLITELQDVLDPNICLLYASFYRE